MVVEGRTFLAGTGWGGFFVLGDIGNMEVVQ